MLSLLLVLPLWTWHPTGPANTTVGRDGPSLQGDVGPLAVADPVVMIISNTASDRRVGQGSVIGGGRLVVTAYHIVFEESEVGLHTMPGIVTVISPYLGEIGSGRILAADREMDLAILEVPWPGHPSYPLASDDEIRALTDVCLLSYQDSGGEEERAERSEIRSQKLPVDGVVTRNDLPVQILLRGQGQLGRGWSGSPMLAEGGEELVGCFTALEGKRANVKISMADKRKRNPRLRKIASGPAAALIRDLLRKVGKEELLVCRHPSTPRGNDAPEAAHHLLNALAIKWARGRVCPEALAELETFLTLRPESGVGTVYLASWLEELGEGERAEAAFKRAVELDPENACIRFFWGQYLADHAREQEAIDQFALAKRLDPNLAVVLDLMTAQALLKLKRLDECQARIHAALAENGENARVLAFQALLHQLRGEPTKALDVLEEAVALWPEIPFLRVPLAMGLQAQGRWAEAERHWRDLIKLEPTNPDRYFQLARLIARHRADAHGEAIELAERALRLPRPNGFDAAKVQHLLARLRTSYQSAAD